ncbi:MAG TPA: helix-turn-helix domain-containing protein [Pyrinomonadaceae bacterium]|nr:helix-turn-helix domain-containing protein [Pyrinomonadaceae bacterium]
MKVTSLNLRSSHLTINEEALLRCQAALEFKDKGRYESAREAMGRLWSRVGERPNTEGLHASVIAEVLLCTGILTRWIGSKNQIKDAQAIAKDLISESIAYYDNLGDLTKVAAARAELAYCYWREGALGEARIMFQEALKKLTTEGNTRAGAILGLAVVEWSDSRFNESLQILKNNAVLFNKITNATIKGAYHNQIAVLLEELAASGDRKAHLIHALKEYGQAEHFFKLAQNKVYLADVKNNVGVVLFRLARFKEAHGNLEQARRLTSTARDKVGIAQIDDTRAQVFIAQNKLKEAEAVAKGAVRVLEKSGHQCLLADALVTHGLALARMKQTERAQFTFQKAISVAHGVGALNKAGLAALTMIEELDSLSPEVAFTAYDSASEWLAKSQSPDLLIRLNVCARKVLAMLRAELAAEVSADPLANGSCDLHSKVLQFESGLIRQALAQANGSVTKAAALLDMSYQGLAYVIGSRHTDLLKERSPVRRRARKSRETGNAPTPQD